MKYYKPNMFNLLLTVFQFVCLFHFATALSCLSDGQLAGIVFGCIFGTLLISAVLAVLLWHIKNRRDNELIKAGAKALGFAEETIVDPAYTNPVFLDEHGHRHSILFDTTKDEMDGNKLKEQQFELHKRKQKVTAQMSSISDCGTKYNKRRRSTLFSGILAKRMGHSMSSTLDAIQSSENLAMMEEFIRVPLQTKDKNGLGFTVQGNMRDGIFIKQLMNRGPAKDSGKVHVGDRLVTLAINFERMVFEDALTILSYASPYSVILELQKTSAIERSQDIPELMESSEADIQPKPVQLHPLFQRSQSTDNLAIKNGIFTAEKFKSEKADARRTKSVAASNQLSSYPHDISLEQNCRNPVKSSLVSLEDEANVQDTNTQIECCTSNTSSTASVLEDEHEPSPPTPPTSDAETDNNPYNELSITDKMQVLRLCYEDTELSQSTPDLVQSELSVGGPSEYIAVHKQVSRHDSAPPTQLPYEPVDIEYNDDDIDTNDDAPCLTTSPNQEEIYGEVHQQVVHDPQNEIENVNEKVRKPSKICEMNDVNEISAHYQETDGEVGVEGHVEEEGDRHRFKLPSLKTVILDEEETEMDDHAQILRQKKAALRQSMERSNWLRPEEDYPIPLNVHPMDDQSSMEMMTSPSSSSSNSDVMLTNRTGVYHLKSSKSMPLNSQTTPRHCNRDSAYSDEDIDVRQRSGSDGSRQYDGDIDRDHYDKLIFFQNQLAKQQDELACLGINVPLKINPIKPQNG